MCCDLLKPDTPDKIIWNKIKTYKKGTALPERKKKPSQIKKRETNS